MRADRADRLYCTDPRSLLATDLSISSSFAEHGWPVHIFGLIRPQGLGKCHASMHADSTHCLYLGKSSRRSGPLLACGEGYNQVWASPSVRFELLQQDESHLRTPTSTKTWTTQQKKERGDPPALSEAAYRSTKLVVFLCVCA